MRLQRLIRGITVVELLVVIAILCLLVAVVFVLAGPARQQTKQASCSSQLRQLHQAVMIYSADVDASEEVLGLGSFSCAIARSGIKPIEPYLKSKDILYCPEFPSMYESRLATNYFWKPIPPDVSPHPSAGEAGMLRRQAELIEKLGLSFPMFTCTIHDEIHFQPREAHINPQFTDPYVVEVSVTGSIYVGRRPYVRGRLLDALAVMP